MTPETQSNNPTETRSNNPIKDFFADKKNQKLALIIGSSALGVILLLVILFSIISGASSGNNAPARPGTSEDSGYEEDSSDSGVTTSTPATESEFETAFRQFQSFKNIRANFKLKAIGGESGDDYINTTGQVAKNKNDNISYIGYSYYDMNINSIERKAGTANGKNMILELYYAPNHKDFTNFSRTGREFYQAFEITSLKNECVGSWTKSNATHLMETEEVAFMAIIGEVYDVNKLSMKEYLGSPAPNTFRFEAHSEKTSTDYKFDFVVKNKEINSVKAEMTTTGSAVVNITFSNITHDKPVTIPATVINSSVLETSCQTSE